MQHDVEVPTTYDEDVSNKTSDNSNSDPDTSRGEQEHVDINTDEGVQLANATGQNNLELLDKRSN